MTHVEITKRDLLNDLAERLEQLELARDEETARKRELEREVVESKNTLSDISKRLAATRDRIYEVTDSEDRTFEAEPNEPS